MNTNKITEFITVLLFAMVLGGGAALTVLYLEGVPRAIALVVLVAAAVASWQYLRTKFRPE